MQGYIVAVMHGGGCCGMTHLYNFPSSPTWNCQARERLAGEALQQYFRTLPHTQRHYNDTRPAETAEERLRAILILMTRINDQSGHTYACRVSGIVEVVLTSVGGQGTATNWRPLLTELGFKEVNQHRNSNSGKLLHVFHLNTGG